MEQLPTRNSTLQLLMRALHTEALPLVDSSLPQGMAAEALKGKEFVDGLSKVGCIPLLC